MRELRFNVFGKPIGVVGAPGNWTAFLLGSEGKRRRADFVVPSELDEEELRQYLADLFHESATAEYNDVVRVD